jgi:8-hydroxy-5-deazaflavin:NADPH oxidoreductase
LRVPGLYFDRRVRPDRLGYMDINELSIGLIGGTGEEGRGLALRWALAGARVTIGSRSRDRAQTTADQLNSLLGKKLIGYATNENAVAANEFVLLTVPFTYAAATLESLTAFFREGSLLIDITVPVSFEKGRASYIELPEGSASRHLSSRLPQSIPLVAAFKTEPAHLLVQHQESLDCDVFVASDSREARLRVIEAIGFMEGVRAIDTGTLESASILERMTVLAIGINRRYKVKTARYKIIGLESNHTE